MTSDMLLLSGDTFWRPLDKAEIFKDPLWLLLLRELLKELTFSLFFLGWVNTGGLIIVMEGTWLGSIIEASSCRRDVLS